MKPRGLGLSRGAPAPRRSPMDEMTSESMDGDLEAMGMEYDDPLDPAPRKPMPADRGGPDFDATDPRQKPKQYDQIASDAYRDFERIVTSGPDDSYNSSEIDEWRRRWQKRARDMGLSEIQANQLLDDVQDGF